MPFLAFDNPAADEALQLVVTLGPASLHHTAALAAAGATSFRLNASHLDADELRSALETVSRACPAALVVVDLQGSKMRVQVAAPREVAAGELVNFSLQADGDVHVPHPEFFSQARAGDTLSIDDGRVRFRVERAGGSTLVAQALTAGRLLDRKGINVEQHPVRLAALTARDRDACALAASMGVTAFAYSFMTDGAEAAWVRHAVPGGVIVGKVERAEATAALDAIAQAVDAVWICRGDLGAQLGMGELARFVAATEPRRFPIPFLMAGQVLEHLTAHRDPTRSEVCHLHDLLARGFGGIVLSDETAIGHDPVHTTEIAAALIASLRA